MLLIDFIKGTPVQNNLSELNSLLHFLHPDLFMRNPDSFVKEFGSNDKSDAQIKSSLDSLKNKIRPFILSK